MCESTYRVKQSRPLKINMSMYKMLMGKILAPRTFGKKTLAGVVPLHLIIFEWENFVFTCQYLVQKIQYSKNEYYCDIWLLFIPSKRQYILIIFIYVL